MAPRRPMREEGEEGEELEELEEFICTLLRLRGLMQRKEEEEIIRRYVTTGNGVSARVVPGLKQNSNDQVNLR